MPTCFDHREGLMAAPGVSEESEGMISHGQKKLLQKGSKERGQSDSGKEPTGKIKEGKSRNLGADKEVRAT